MAGERGLPSSERRHADFYHARSADLVTSRLLPPLTLAWALSLDFPCMSAYTLITIHSVLASRAQANSKKQLLGVHSAVVTVDGCAAVALDSEELTRLAPLAVCTCAIGLSRQTVGTRREKGWHNLRPFSSASSSLCQLAQS